MASTENKPFLSFTEDEIKLMSSTKNSSIKFFNPRFERNTDFSFIASNVTPDIEFYVPSNPVEACMTPIKARFVLKKNE